MAGRRAEAVAHARRDPPRRPRRSVRTPMTVLRDGRRMYRGRRSQRYETPA